MPTFIWAQATDDSTPEKILVYALLPFLMSFIFIFYIFLRRKRESDIRRKIAETEMKALRAQMNPHFIFNSLNSIFHFIQENKSDEAGQYLLKFSKLMRTVLENSRHKSITVEEDISALKLYMDLESLRKNFSYTFHVQEGVDLDQYLVPPMILQPFIENSIIHGFAHKQEGAFISIEVKKEGDELLYITTDNGQIDNSPAKAKNHQSLGTVVTKERLALLQTSTNKKARFTSEDLTSAEGNYVGKKIVVFLPLEENL